MQTDFSARALVGLFGDDDFSLKVSPDGATFLTGLAIDKDTGNVAIGGGPDANNRPLVSGESTLFTNPGDVRLNLSKGAAANDATLSFQTGFAAHFLVGLLANDHLTLKYTPNGVTYPSPPALVVNNKSGRAVFKKLQNGPRPFNVVLRNHVAQSAWLTSATPADNSWYSVVWAPSSASSWPSPIPAAATG